ncbi:AAA family ATPase [Calothrix sp. FACHB-1219]|uniref:AAA family ATPase n=1 Tax=unclassified Calothrix TaxID=2619626 RepID=UPI001689CDE4|nr:MULTISPECIES: AAA family ATPase [unclassified Calothrix]MBD2201788.1 AAA family ATPase [Calothrix sp. FACHB-168]MBD2217474.1 AAA family ATPase [Calothrix sp. FACHB-1219]
MTDLIENKYTHWSNTKIYLATSSRRYEALIAPAGCGKSTLIKDLLNEDPNYGCLTSSTGISAVNIGGSTIHSKLGYKDIQSLIHEVENGNIIKKISWIARDGFRRIIIDELSMLSGEELDLICFAIERYNKSNFVKEWGEISLLGVADIGQLPAVKGKPFFQSKVWKHFNVNYLYEVMRQDERDYINSLLAVRLGKANEVVDWFDEHVGFNKDLDNEFNGATIFATNAKADDFNRLRLSQLKGVEKGYRRFITGKARSEWNSIPEELRLKVGSKVILLKNNHNEGYANGDLAIVKDMYIDKIIVEVLRKKKEVMIEYIKLENKTHKDGASIGELAYLPVRGADGLTVWKMQSLTVAASQIYLKEPFLGKTSGALYVALSRVRTKEGLRLVGNRSDFIKRCYVDPINLPMIINSTKFIN